MSDVIEPTEKRLHYAWVVAAVTFLVLLVTAGTAQKLKIRALSSGITHGAGKGEVSASDAGEVQFAVGGLTTRVPHAKIVDLSKVPLPEKIDGLLGAEFLEQYVVRIDPAQHKIAFYDPKAFAYQGDEKSIPLGVPSELGYLSTVRIFVSSLSGLFLAK